MYPKFLHSSTGSVIRQTSLNFSKCLRNVVLPLPIFPSTKTVNGFFVVEYEAIFAAKILTNLVDIERPEEKQKKIS